MTSATSTAAPVALPPFVPLPAPTWTPDPNQSYSTRGYTAEDGTQRLYTVAEAAALFPPAPDPTVSELAAEKLEAIASVYGAKIAGGFSYVGLIVDIDDGSRANLTGLALTGALVKQGLGAWPTNFSRGWIARGGQRIPLPTPDDGIALATAAAAYYSALAQHEQDLADEVTVATSPAVVIGVDPTLGWPANASAPQAS